MEKIDFTQNGGYRMKQSTFKKMQDGYFEILAAFVSALGIPNVGNYIISGCYISGINITDGFMFIDGELCPFSSIVGDNNTKIKKLETFQTVAFENGSNPPVWKTTTAVEDVSGTKLSDFIRINLVIDPNYVHTDYNFTLALLNKLNGIENGAEVNLQADWNVTNPLSDAYIKNKPTFLKVLYKQTVLMGDVANNDYTIAFPSVGTSNYHVYVSFETAASNAGQSATYVYVVHSKTDTSFKVRMNETGNQIQALTMNYFIIEN